MTQRRFLPRGKAVAFALVSASVLGASPAMAGPVTCADVPTTAACIAPPLFLWEWWWVPLPF